MGWYPGKYLAQGVKRIGRKVVGAAKRVGKKVVGAAKYVGKKVAQGAKAVWRNKGKIGAAAAIAAGTAAMVVPGLQGIGAAGIASGVTALGAGAATLSTATGLAQAAEEVFAGD